MKFTSSILLVLSALHSVKAAVETSNVNDNKGVNPCSTSVSIDCVLKSGESCVSDTASDGKIVPWAWYPKSECGETQKADITYKMCNNNDSGTIALNGGETYAKFTGNAISDSKFAGDFEPGCKEVTITEDLAKCRANPVGIQMSGPIKERTGKNGCYSYAFNKSRSKAIPTTEVIEARLYEHKCENCGNTSVAIGCSFMSNGKKRSCISNDREFTFLNMPKSACDGVSVEATITMRQCNNGDETIKPNENLSSQKFKGNSIANASSSEDLGPGECVETVTTQFMDTCKSNFPMSINLKPQGTCKCYLFKTAKIDSYDGPIDNNPEIENSGGRQDAGTPLVLWITEIADPNGNNKRRFIELYSPNKRGYVINESISLVKFRGGKNTHAEIYVSLTGLRIDKNGFLLICNDTTLVDACEYTPDTPEFDNFLDGNMGKNDWAIAEVDSETPLNSRIIDIFGVPGKGAKNSNQNFVGGRAFRKARVNRPNGIWTIDEWIVAPSIGNPKYADSVGASETSPGCWYGAGMDCTEDLVGPPTVSPAPSSEADKNLYELYRYELYGGAKKTKDGKGGKGGTSTPKAPSKSRRRSRL